MKDVKTCVTCIYKKGDSCTKQAIEPKIDLVTGRSIGRTTFFRCATQRSYTFNSCGEDGKWWSPIPNEKEKPRGPSIFHRTVIRVLSVFRD